MMRGLPSGRCPECGANTENGCVVIGKTLLAQRYKWPVFVGLLIYIILMVFIGIATGVR